MEQEIYAKMYNFVYIIIDIKKKQMHVYVLQQNDPVYLCNKQFEYSIINHRLYNNPGNYE